MSLNLKMEYDEATLENFTLQMKGTSKGLLKGKDGDDGAEISEIKTSEKNLKKDMEKQAKKTKTNARKMAKPQKTAKKKEPPKKNQAVGGEMQKRTSEADLGRNGRSAEAKVEKMDSSEIKKKKRKHYYSDSDSDSDTTGTETTSSDSDSSDISSDSE